MWSVEVGGLEMVKTKHVFPRVTTPWIRWYSCSVFGTPWFESRPGHRLSLLRLFMVFLSLYSACRCSISKQKTPVPSTSLPNNYSLHTLSCADRLTGSVVKKTDIYTCTESLKFQRILLLPPEGMTAWRHKLEDDRLDTVSLKPGFMSQCEEAVNCWPDFY
jgi:hypothetical protein